MADAYDATAPADAGVLANTTPAELRALKSAITGAEAIAASRANKFLAFNAAGTAIILIPRAAAVATTSGAALAALETNVNAIITALKTAGLMAP